MAFKITRKLTLDEETLKKILELIADLYPTKFLEMKQDELLSLLYCDAINFLYANYQERIKATKDAQTMLLSPPEDYTIEWFERAVSEYGGKYLLLYCPRAEIRDEDRSRIDRILHEANSKLNSSKGIIETVRSSVSDTNNTVNNDD